MDPRQIRRQGGFNLVELMVVVAIIGILTSVAVPKFATFKARAQQTEARSGLNGIFLAMQAYEANYNAFPDISNANNATNASIGFAVSGNQPKYAYRVRSNPTTSAWAATAYSADSTSINNNAATTTAPTAKVLANKKTDKMRINANKWICSPYDAVSMTKAISQTTGQTATAATNCPQIDNTDGSVAAFNPVIQDAANGADVTTQ